jgi:predicted class III extradiol MEMO1 family dioxygenase
MGRFQVAHIREQGQDLIVIFVSDAMHYEPDTERSKALLSLQIASRRAGLAGAVVLVWEYAGQMEVFCHTAFHNFFQSVPYQLLAANINKTLDVAA